MPALLHGLGKKEGDSMAMLSFQAQLLSWGILGTSELALQPLLLLFVGMSM